MKKWLAGWLILCLALGCGWSAAWAEAAEAPAVDEFFRSMEGRLSFTLPGVPTVYVEADLDEETARSMKTAYLGWTDKLQLVGESEDGAEYQVHIADLTPMMNLMREENPGAEEAQYQFNAMMNLAQFYLSLYDGEITKGPEMAVIDLGDRQFPTVGFAYRYPDAEGVKYSAKGIMDGSRAVLIMCQLDEANEAVLADFRTVTQQEADAFQGRQPETVTLGRMQITFPVPPESHPQPGHEFYHVFSPDYGYLNAEHLSISMAALFMEEGEDEDAFLESMASSTAEQYQQAGVLDSYTVQKEAEGVYSFRGVSREAGYPEDHGPLATLSCGFITLDGVYVVETAATEMGLAFVDSITFTEE